MDEWVCGDLLFIAGIIQVIPDVHVLVVWKPVSIMERACSPEPNHSQKLFPHIHTPLQPSPSFFLTHDSYPPLATS